MNNEQKILFSWQANANNWIELLENNGIESRQLATNQAIIDAVCKTSPQTVLDLGCGEGWLSSVLAAKGKKVSGVDAIPALVEKAREKVEGDFSIATYEQIASGEFRFPSRYDAIVINFALIDQTATEQMLPALPSLLQPGGTLYIQTLHPHTRKSMNDYVTGWKEGSWDGLGPRFTQSYQWYFRTLEEWLRLLHEAGFATVQTNDILHPQSGQPLSVIFECRG